ncbi:MAG: cytochrome c oxidase assembly protein [Caldilineaceae bacterium]
MPQNLWQGWSWEPLVLFTLLVTALVYLWGVRTLWRRAGANHGVRYWQTACFLGGILTIFIALLSPLDLLSEALFSAHMVQHLLLLLVAPSLFVLSRPLAALLWALPWPLRLTFGRWQRRRWVQGGWRLFTIPLLVWSLNTVVLWLWHAPRFYQAALANEAVHALEHVSFLAAATLFWWTVIHPQGGRRYYGVSLLYVFLTTLQGGLLGALLTFSSTLWYPVYGPLAKPWGLTPLADQQLAGLIMWVPAGLLYLLAAALLFVVWLTVLEQGMQRRKPVTTPHAQTVLRPQLPIQ